MARCDARMWLFGGGLLFLCGCEMRVASVTPTAGKPEVHFVFTSAVPAAASASALPMELALDGCCPVTLVQNSQWRRGEATLGVVHRGATYRFVSGKERQAFLAKPDRYAVVAAGYDVVAATDQQREVRGDRRHGVFYEDRIFLFESEASLETFWKKPHTYAAPYFAQEQLSNIAAASPASASSTALPKQEGALTQNVGD